jgi:hypothetical protein
MRRTSVLVFVVACLVSVLVGTDRQIRAQDTTPSVGPPHPHAVGITLTDLGNGIPTRAPDQGLRLHVILGCAIALTGVADRSLAPVPARSAGVQLLSEAGTPSPSATHPAGTWTTPGSASKSIANREHGQPQDRFAAQRAATTLPVVDRSRDRRADLMDMAAWIRWHRGAAPDLSPGSNITGTSTG